ncbi:MAG: class I SAM-dependent methyltransferase [Methanomicrobiales archaeon]
MNEDSEVWEKDYSQRGAIWSGSVHNLPVFPTGGRILELGCGNGKSLTSICQRYSDVTAIDFSPCAVSMCKPITDAVQNGSVCVADVRWLPFPPEVFDGVIASHVLSHMQFGDRVDAAFESVRMVKKAGILYFSGFSTDDFRSGKGSVIEKGTMRKGQGICTHYFTEEEVQVLFCTLTLQSIRTKRWSLRVRGVEYPRAEIQATFIK